MSEQGNGLVKRTNGVSAILDHESETALRKKGFADATEEEIERREAEIQAFRDERHKARIGLCARLGDFGFTYDPEKHSIVKISVVEPPEPERTAVSPLSVTEPFDPKKYGIPSKEPNKFAPKLLLGIEILTWVAVPFLGAFVGYSIGLLAGLPVKTDTAFAVMSVAFGAFLLAAMKGSIYGIMQRSARWSANTGAKGWLAAAFLVSLLLIAAEAGLGTVAILRYSQERALTEAEVINPWYALLMALCFSTPILFSSLVKGWYDGSTHDDDLERSRAEAQQHHRAMAEAQRQHELELVRRDEEARAKLQEAQRQFEVADEKYRNDDRWKTAMSLFSAIQVLNIEIADREQLLTSYRLRRGHGELAQA